MDLNHLLRTIAAYSARGRKAQRRGLYVLAFGWYNQAIGVLGYANDLHREGKLELSEEEQMRLGAMQDSLIMTLDRLSMKERNGGQRLSGKEEDSVSSAAQTMLQELTDLWT